MKRGLILTWGLLAYALFGITSLYAAGFLIGIGTPTSLDGPARMSFGEALAVNVALLCVFALQHSVMARPAFKAWWTKIVPAAAERSTYMVFSCVALGLIFWLWEPMGGDIWQIEQPVLRGMVWGLYVIGWLTVVGSSSLINHFDLFGLRQSWLHFRGEEYTHLPFRTPGPYQLVRHPLYVGWLLVFWSTPSMGIAHFCFAIGMTVYILVAIQYEEQDLINVHGEDYERYREQVPMLLPRLVPRGKSSMQPSAE